ncbi:AraC family transcriptional regulator, partial [Clavibacter michiganensis subsp. michiganensis]|nr:AraC family transcriptional regulator [Clavibacter michiganensis subsp. michiganensis]
MTTTLPPIGTRDASLRPSTPHADPAGIEAALVASPTAASDAASLLAPSPSGGSSIASASDATPDTASLGTGPLSLVAGAGAAVMGMAADSRAAAA